MHPWVQCLQGCFVTTTQSDLQLVLVFANNLEYPETTLLFGEPPELLDGELVFTLNRFYIAHNFGIPGHDGCMNTGVAAVIERLNAPV